MKISPKKKVQAQRKFAQGAYIPTSCAALAPARCEPPTHHATPARDERNVIKNNVSAAHLLDIVSFQKMHNHLSPVVVLHRIVHPAKELVNGTQNGINGQTSSEVPAKPILTIPPSPAANISPTKPKKLSSKNNTMCLRPKGTVINKAIRKMPKRMKSIKLRKSKRSVIKLRRKRPRERASSDAEDERPLQYFKRSKETATEDEHRVLRPTTSKAKDKNPQSAATEEQHQASTNNTSEKNLQLSATEDDHRVLRPTTSKAKDKNPQSAEKQHQAIFPSTSNTSEKNLQLSGTKDQPIPFLCTIDVKIEENPLEPESLEAVVEKAANSQPAVADVKTFKEPAIPTRSLRSVPQPSTENTNTDTEKPVENKSEKHEKSTHLYSSTGIERWLTEQAEPSVSMPVTRGGSPSPAESVQVTRGPSPCPSESLLTVRDVMHAPAALKTTRCNNCNSCKRVKSVEKIASLLQRQRCKQTKQNSNHNSDVYEFSDRDEAADPPSVYLHLRRNSKHRETRASSSDEDEQHIYLDLHQDSTQIIQIKVPNSRKRTMKGRLVKKSDAQTTDDFSLIEHENLLDQLLQSLMIVIDPDEQYHHDEEFLPGPSKQPVPNTSDNEKTAPEGGISTRTRARVEGTHRDAQPKPSTSRAKGTTKSGPELEGKLLEAPVYRPTEAEFTDPIAYFESIAPSASKYGICKVIAPPGFQPRCVLNDNIKFNVTNHYVGRLYSRWGPSAREMSAIKAYLASQNVTFHRVPLMDGLEVNLAKLYAAVQRNGGLKEVIEKKRWYRVADEMGFAKTPNTEKILDSYYVKYLLPYDTATKQERQAVVASVDRIWEKKHKKLVAWSHNPLHHQKKLLGESESSEEDEDAESGSLMFVMREAEDCIVPGRPMVLSGFKRVAQNAMSMYLGDENATPEQVEEAYWQLVLFGMEHVCVNAASIDTSAEGYGFSKSKTDPTCKHPWNLKNFSSNTGNVLRSLGSVLGVTVPTLHLGMVFSTSCWHRDPHGLPWIEYLHEGAPKIWYGIPDEQSTNFRNAVSALCPTSCQNKEIWLSSDITMIPPNILRENKVTLSKTIQEPGQFILVFPKSFSCSIATGYTVTESVYFATKSWLTNVHLEFQELRSSCEPTTFSLEHLLLNLARDVRMSTGVLQQVLSELTIIVRDELADRRALMNMGIRHQLKQHVRSGSGAWNVREHAECAICRATLYLSKVSGVLGKKKELCLAHALRLLQKREAKAADGNKNIVMTIFRSENQLEEIMDGLRRRILE